jgi:TonB-dependent starch-binding outer membrane protein SusC
LEYYKMETTDLLLSRRIPNMTGYESFLTNIGAVENHGFELTLNTENIRSGDFLWTSNLVFSLNRNKITHLTGDDLNGDGIEDDDVASKRFIGEPLGANYDYVWDGIWQEGDDMSIDPSAKPGFVKFKDISGPDGVPDGKIGPDDRTVISSQDPKFIAGLTNTFSYKGFSMSFLLNMRYGGEKPNSLLNLGTNYFDAANVMDLPYWTPEKPLKDRPSVGYPNPLGYGFYESTSFTRLQDLTVSYTFSNQILSKIKINNLKIYASGKNLITWTNWHGWDPEHGVGGQGNQYAEDTGPLMRTWTFGINVGL